MSGDTLSDWLDRIGEKHGFTESVTPEEDEMPSGPSIAARDDFAASSANAPVSFAGDDVADRSNANARGPSQSRPGAPAPADDETGIPDLRADLGGVEPPPPDADPRTGEFIVKGLKFVGEKAVEFGIGKVIGLPGIVVGLPIGSESDDSPAQREARKRQEEKDLKEFEEEKAKEQRELQEANERGRAPVELNPIKVFDAPAVRETGSAITNAFGGSDSFQPSAPEPSPPSGGGERQPEQIQQPAGTVQDDDDDD